ncbi:MAG: isochorismatase [Phycisphaerales bacterium]|nr:isochorismatase [Phycisphaerales bacterium]
MSPIPPNSCPLRLIRGLPIVTLAGFRLKLITITASGSDANPHLLEAAQRTAERHLRERPTHHEHYGVGFLGVHDGHGENQVFLDLWINRNELTHTIWTSPKHDPGALTSPPADSNSVCIWDLAAQAFERDAWLRHVLRNPAGPDIEAYLSARADFKA